MVMSYWFYRIEFCSVGSAKKNTCVLINLLAIGLIHAGELLFVFVMHANFYLFLSCRRIFICFCHAGEFLFVFVMHANFYLFLSVKKVAELTRQTVTFIDFKDVVSKLVS